LPPAISPGIGSSLAGTAQCHVPVKAEPVSSRKKKAAAAAGVAVDVAKAGQSYHPDPVAHRQVVEKAVDVEIRRNAAVEQRSAPISRGMSKETREILLGDSDSEDDSSSDDDSDSDPDAGHGRKAAGGGAGEEDKKGNGDGDGGPLPKRTEKLTRAQRNRQKRIRREKYAEEKRKEAKKLMNQVGEAGRYRKELKREERMRAERKEQIAKAKELRRRLPGKDVEHHASRVSPIDAPTVPVALSDEIKSSLRTLKPKGSLVRDRMSSMIDRKLAPKPTRVIIREDGTRHPQKRRKLNVKGKRNNEGVGPDFVVMG
jgi:nucleolar protein 53